MKKILALLILAVMVVSMVGCSGKKKGEDGYTVTYTYNTYSAALADKWNPHTWETSADGGVLSYMSTPLVDISIKDSENSEYQWEYKAATGVKDVTAEHRDDLAKYNVVFKEGESASTVTEGYVFQITLREGIKWQNGEEITADDYVESFKRCLDPDMQNYRANTYYSGDRAVAGANGYFHSGRTAYTEGLVSDVAALVKGNDGVYETASGKKVYIAVNTPIEGYLQGSSLADFVGAGYLNEDALAKLIEAADANGNLALTDETLATLIETISTEEWNESEKDAFNYLLVEEAFPVVTWDTVGLYKLDDYNLIWVNEVYTKFNYLLTDLTSSWLVYIPLYDGGKDTAGSLVTTDYGTSLETTMSFGPYIISSLQEDKQLVYTKNPYYYAFEEDKKTGRLVGHSQVEVDGEYPEIWMADKIVVDVMTDDAAKQAFLKGGLDAWEIPAVEVPNYSLSDKLYKADESFTMRMYFHTNLDSLKEMDKSKGNQNSVVMSNWNFRKGFTLSIDRNDWVKATAGYKPQFGMLNTLYFYNLYDDPTSMYRASDEGMQAICDLYHVEYGPGKTYATLKDAFDSITGYNVTEAKEYFTKALAELEADGLYKAGDPIKIRLGWKKGSLDSTDNQQVQLLQDYLNAALEGTGFGTVTLEPVGNITNRYLDTARGEFAIGWGAWGGDIMSPFSIFRVYCDAEYLGGKDQIHEAGCWDPSIETLTINIDGEDVTMTWKDWSNSCVGSGPYNDPDSFDKQLKILSTMEKEFLDFVYCIPLAGSTSCNMLSYKVHYWTDLYNVLYGFGGMELMQFDYTDEDWAKFVEKSGGTLSYE